MFQVVDLNSSCFTIETFFNDFGTLNDHLNRTQSLVRLQSIYEPITSPFELSDMNSLKVTPETDPLVSNNHRL